MNMISQLPQPARLEAVGDRRLPVQVPIAQWTDYERRCNRIIEDLMIASIKPRRKSHIAEMFGDSRTNEQRAAETRKAILAQLDTPKTAQEIAAAIGKCDSTISTRLNVLRKAGIVDYTEPPREGYPKGRIWRKLVRANIEANIAKGAAKRERLFAIMDKPQTVREMAERLGVKSPNVRDMLNVLEREGRVERAGKTPKRHHGGIADLWVRT